MCLIKKYKKYKQILQDIEYNYDINKIKESELIYNDIIKSRRHFLDNLDKTNLDKYMS